MPKKAGGSKGWKDWKKNDDKDRRRIQELERRKKKGSTNTDTRKRKAVEAMVTVIEPALILLLKKTEQQ